jgi:hypothetical protein
MITATMTTFVPSSPFSLIVRFVSLVKVTITLSLEYDIC